MQGLPGAAGPAESLFQAFHVEIRDGAESAEAAHSPGQGLDEALLDLGKISVGHEDIVLDLRRQFVRRLAADGRHVLVRDIMPLLLFPQQFLADDTQRTVDEHAQVRRGELIARPFFQTEAVAGKISEGTAAVLFEFRDRAAQRAV